MSRSSLRAFLQRLVTCAPNLMLVATQAFAPAKRRDAAPRRPPRGGGGPAASAAAASRHSRSARRLVPRGAGGDQGASVFALCRVLVPRTRHAGARRRSSIHLSSEIFAAGALRHPVRIPRNRRSLRRRRGSDSGHRRRATNNTPQKTEFTPRRDNVNVRTDPRRRVEPRRFESRGGALWCRVSAGVGGRALSGAKRPGLPRERVFRCPGAGLRRSAPRGRPVDRLRPGRALCCPEGGFFLFYRQTGALGPVSLCYADGATDGSC